MAELDEELDEVLAGDGFDGDGDAFAAVDDDDGFAEDDAFDDDAAADDDDGSAESEEVVAPVDTSDGDDDDELAVEPAVDIGLLDGLADDEEVVDDEDDDEDDVITDGEFVCSSCHMAKRASALADPDERLCRDCV